MQKKYNIAVVGATGNVGREILQILEQRKFPIDNIFCLASARSKGKKLDFKYVGNKQTVKFALSEMARGSELNIFIDFVM